LVDELDVRSPSELAPTRGREKLHEFVSQRGPDLLLQRAM